MKFASIILLLLPCFPCVAQWDAKVAIAITAIQVQDFELAISELRLALEHEQDMDEKNVVKAYYHLGDALVRESQKQMSVKGDEVEQKYAAYIFEAVDVLVKARSLAEKTNLFKDDIEIRVNTVFNSLLMSVVQLTNSAGQVKPNEKAPYLAELIRVCNALILLRPDHYIGFDYRGQTYLSLTDTAKAYSDLSNALQLYQTNMPNGPDAMAGYIYYRTALIEFYGHKNTKKALELLNIGLARIASDQKAVESDNGMTAEGKQDVLDKFFATRNDLRLFKLDLLMKSANLSPSELKELELGIKEFPDNVNVRLAYAQRIQNEQPEIAISIYDQILKAQPDNINALFNAGVLYYNRAANLSKALSEDSNAMRTDEALMYELFRQALPYFERAYQLGETNSKQILLSIANFLGDKQLLKKYQ